MCASPPLSVSAKCPCTKLPVCSAGLALARRRSTHTIRLAWSQRRHCLPPCRRHGLRALAFCATARAPGAREPSAGVGCAGCKDGGNRGWSGAMPREWGVTPGCWWALHLAAERCPRVHGRPAEWPAEWRAGPHHGCRTLATQRRQRAGCAGAPVRHRAQGCIASRGRRAMLRVQAAPRRPPGAVVRVRRLGPALVHGAWCAEGLGLCATRRAQAWVVWASCGTLCSLACTSLAGAHLQARLAALVPVAEGATRASWHGGGGGLRPHLFCWSAHSAARGLTPCCPRHSLAAFHPMAILELRSTLHIVATRERVPLRKQSDGVRRRRSSQAVASAATRAPRT